MVYSGPIYIFLTPNLFCYNEKFISEEFIYKQNKTDLLHK